MFYTGTQVEFARDKDISNLRHGIYSTHSVESDDKNSVVFTVWNPEEDVNNEVSRNVILEINGDNNIKTVHILPLEPEVFDIGIDDLRWNILIGSSLKTDVLQSKTIGIYSGK
jgi:hypothetical protein